MRVRGASGWPLQLRCVLGSEQRTWSPNCQAAAPIHYGKWKVCKVPSGLPRPRQHQRHVVWLLIRSNPIIHGGSHDFADPGQRQVPVFAHQFDQAMLAEFAKIVFWFGYTIAVSHEDFAAPQLDRTLLVAHALK